jgi:uncharacterized protein YifE (UPF0438 family)
MNKIISFDSPEGLFYDKHFPRGFSKHGVFTIHEAELLHNHGRAMFNIANHIRLPKNAEEKRFLSVCQLEEQPQTAFEKVWIKYQEAIGAKLVFFSLSSSSNHRMTERREEAMSA